MSLTDELCLTTKPIIKGQPSTAFQFSLLSDGIVTLEVYNNVGRESRNIGLEECRI
jgi:hypothetical protein